MCEMNSLLADEMDRSFRLPFDVSVNLSTMESVDRRMAGAMRKSSHDFTIELASKPRRAVLRLNGRTVNEDSTLCFRAVDLVVTQRALVTDDFSNVRELGLWKQCYTEPDCAGIMLYYDVFLQLLCINELGIEVNTSDLHLFNETTRFFASLVKGSGPAAARVCEVCGVAAKHKCNTCRKVYYCSKACQTLAFPVHKRIHH